MRHVLRAALLVCLLYLVAAFVLAPLAAYLRKMPRTDRRTAREFEMIQLACKMYRTEVGAYPKAETVEDLLRVLTMPMAEGRGPVLRLRGEILKSARDQWGNPIVFRQTADGDWVLESSGPDGLSGNDDGFVMVLWTLEPESDSALPKTSEKSAIDAVSSSDSGGTEETSETRARPNPTHEAQAEQHSINARSPSPMEPAQAARKTDISIHPGKATIVPCEPTSILIEVPGNASFPHRAGLVVRERASGTEIMLSLLLPKGPGSKASSASPRRHRVQVFVAGRGPRYVFEEPGLYDIELRSEDNETLASASIDVVPEMEGRSRSRELMLGTTLLYGGAIFDQSQEALNDHLEATRGDASVFRGHVLYACGMASWDNAMHMRMTSREDKVEQLRRLAELAPLFQEALKFDLDPYYSHRAAFQLAVCEGHGGDFDTTERICRDLLDQPQLETELMLKATRLLEEIVRHQSASPSEKPQSNVH